MKFHVSQAYPKNLDALILHVAKGRKTLPPATHEADKRLKGFLKKEMAAAKFEGGLGQTLVVHNHDARLLPVRKVILTGLGPWPASPDAIRKSVAAAMQQAQSCHLAKLARPVPDGQRPDVVTVAEAVAEGALLGTYRFTKHKSQDKTAAQTLTLVGGSTTARRESMDGIRRGQTAAEAQILARDLANEPPSHLTPKQLAKEARAVARKGGLGISVLGPAEIKRAGLGALLAVARGSDEPPQLIKLTYRSRKAGAGKQKHIVLVGKSITYDSGGLNLKPSRGGALEDMKLDMSGGAAVLGAMSALKKLGVRHKVTGYLPATENLVGGSAYKPGDVVMAYNGKTIEVGNTDAEGRLTLADTLAYAVDKDKPDEIVDLATLTATEISLGPSYAAIFASQPRMEERFTEAGERTGERVWPLPFPEEYDEMTKSAVADFSNIVSGRAYTLSGPLLLKHFVGKTPWVHLDIGSAAMAAKDSGYIKKGGSGWGTRLLLEYLSN